MIHFAEPSAYFGRSIAFAIALLAHGPIYCSNVILRYKVADDDDDAPDVPSFVGVIERLLYVGALQYDAHTLIGAWLVLKVAAKWGKWGQPTLLGRDLYNIFLLGTGLSLGYSAVGFWIGELLASGKKTEAAFDFGWLVAGSVVLVWVAALSHGRERSTNPDLWGKRPKSRDEVNVIARWRAFEFSIGTVVAATLVGSIWLC